MPKNQGLKIMIDTSALAEKIGAVQGASEYAMSQEYLQSLIENAHAEVSSEFDLQIASDAMATGTMGHMFEWGTAGINRGRTTRRMNPLSQAAKLWSHNLQGAGKNMSANFTFNPSTVPVPQPTTTSTGVSQTNLAKLSGKQHIFWNKAMIMETGATVTISPKSGKKLFIPIKGNPAPGMSPSEIKRGFVMTSKTVTATPGGNNVGTFTAYWMRFWGGQGAASMQSIASRDFERDLEQTVNSSGRASGSVAPPSATAFRAQVKAGKAKGKRKMRASSMKGDMV